MNQLDTPTVARLLAVLLVLVLPACASDPDPADVIAGASEESVQDEEAIPAETPEAIPAETTEAISAETPEAIARLLQPWHGDWEEMVERRVIRVLVTFNRTNFFLDGGRQRGITADALHQFEKALNSELQLGNRRLHVAAIPVPRDRLIPYLEQGRGDLAAANLTITPERLDHVEFSVPALSSVNEIVVTGPGSPALRALDDLAGQRVHVRRSSSFYQSLQELNASFRERGLAEIEIVPASEVLETEDLLEMVSAGLIPITIADDFLAGFWAQIFPDLMLHQGLAVAQGRQIAWALRKDATGLKERADRFVQANRKGTLLGNMLFKRYLKNLRFVKNALGQEEGERFRGLVELFRKYGELYEFDYLMVAAQAFQESGLDQSVVSAVGAVGVMQVLPSTAADRSVGIPDIRDLENNIHAGTKYLRHLVNVYFNDPEIDSLNRQLFAFAGYNAGPNRIRRLRGQAGEMGYDPNVWFRNVEVVVASRVGREPVQYVSNIFKYYTAYSLIEAQRERREQARTN